MDLFRQWEYPKILCWGHNANIFQFKFFRKDAKSEDDLQLVSLQTPKGSEIEVVLLDTVKRLMSQMEEAGMSDLEFASMLSSIVSDPDMAATTARTATLARKLTSHQLAQVVRSMREVAPFDAVEVCVALHPRMINQEAFQLVLNEFPEDADRENICHRLGIRPDNHYISAGKTSGTSDA